MSSMKDYQAISNWGSPVIPQLFTQNTGEIDPLGINRMVTATPATSGNWMDGFNKLNTPSFMQAGFQPGTPAGGADTGLMKFLFGDGSSANPGNIGPLVSGGQALMGGYLGFQQLGAAKDKLAESKRQFELNYGAQKTLTNSQLEDRQRARVASNASAYESVGDYMKKNGVV